MRAPIRVAEYTVLWVSDDTAALPMTINVAMPHPDNSPLPKYTLVAEDKDGNGLYANAGERYRHYLLWRGDENVREAKDWIDADAPGRGQTNKPPYSPPAGGRWRWRRK